MAAHIEWVTGDRIGVVRTGDSFLNYGDQYDFSATVVIIGDTATLIGAFGIFNSKWREDILNILRESNVKFISWERKRKNGTKHIVKFEIKRLHK